VTNLVLVITFGLGAFSGLVAQPDNVIMKAIVKYLMGLSLSYNATLSGKKLLAKIVNGVKQPTVFCPFERLVRHFYTLAIVL
jgi:hypothetical protein